MQDKEPELFPIEVFNLGDLDPARSDHAFLVAASWEERCLGLTRHFGSYRAPLAIITIYDGASDLRGIHLAELRAKLTACCPKVIELSALHNNAIPNVRAVITNLKLCIPATETPRLSIDLSTYTRRHLLQLLHGLDMAGFLHDCRFFYSEQEDYHTQCGFRGMSISVPK